MAGYNSQIDNVYNYYLTAYAPKTDSKYDTHKKSELRSVYNSIVKMNSDAPVYIVDRSQETKEYAIGLKENARAFRNTIASLGGLEDEELLNKKVAYSSNESLAEAQYIGEDNSGADAPEFSLGVQKLATTQVNHGKMLSSDSMDMEEGTYSFDIATNGLNYEFQYNISEGDTNKSVQEKLARLITNSDIGLKADVMTDGQGNSAIRIESENTGTPSNGSHMFEISDNNTSRTSGSVDYFGLSNVVQNSSNSEFTVNGNHRESSSNSFTVEKQYEITLKAVSTGESDETHIGLKADTDSMISNVSKLVDGFNAFVENADSYSEKHPKSGRLVGEMASLAEMYSESLEKLGISVGEDSTLTLDEEKFESAVGTEDFSEDLEGLKKFAGAVLRKSNQVSLDPMEYVDKKIAAYKNPGHNFSSPYVTSNYMGMMFNSYC